MLQTLKYLSLLLLLSSCSTLPNGPSILVLPGDGKNFAVFQDDDATCRKFADRQIQASPNKPDCKEEGQQSYDISYIQCMYAKGHRVPVPGALLFDAQQDWQELSPPPDIAPPPSSGPLSPDIK